MTSKNLTYRGYTGSIEPSVEDECLHGRILFIDDIVSYEGDTVPAIVEAFKAAVDRYIDYCERTGKPANKPYSGSFNVRIGQELHRKAAQAAHKHGVTLNEYITKVVQAAVEQNEPAKVEHVHQHSIVVSYAEGQKLYGTVAATGAPALWEAVHATTH